MKKITLLVAVIVAFSISSCKKDRTCTCMYSHAGSSKVDTYITTYTKVNNKTAEINCTSGKSYNQSEPAEFQTRDCEVN
jgi:hypothetical protein